MTKDFEVKRLVVGLSSLILNLNSLNFDQSIQARFQDFMKAINFLCGKSLEIREKKLQKQKAAEAEEDKECNDKGGVIFDEDEETGAIDLGSDDDDSEWDLDSDNEDDRDNDLYDTKFDAIDEILYVKDQLEMLQQ